MSEFKVPSWHGRHPFSPDQKKPTVLTRDKIRLFLLYGKTAYTDLNWLFVSTDKLHAGIYQIPPGGRFDPPDIHAGDEVYYMLEGTVHVFNPSSGEVHLLNANEGLLIPENVWHQGHNVSNKYVRGIWAIAPLMWDLEKGPPTEYPGKPKLFDSKILSESPAGPRMTVLNRNNARHFMHGKQHRVPITVYTSTKSITMGEFALGLNEFSEPISFEGDSIVSSLSGDLTVFIPKTEETFEVRSGEVMFIPEKVVHQHYNFTSEMIRSLFIVAPGI